MLFRDVDRVEVAILGKKLPPRFLDALVQARVSRAFEFAFGTLVMAYQCFAMQLGFGAPGRHEIGPGRSAENVAMRFQEAAQLGDSFPVIGWFELLSTRAAQATNDPMRKLTFATVLMGVLALGAGVMGMNFQAPFFATGVAGFLVVIGSMVVLVVIAVWIGIRRSWI